MRIILLSLLFFFGIPVFGQTIPNESTLSLEEIMKGNEFIGHQPENIRWSVDGTKIYFDWNPANEPGNSLFEFSPYLKGSKPILSDPKKMVEYDPAQSNYPDQYILVDGALVHYDKKTKTSKRIYHTNTEVRSFARTNDPAVVFFQVSSNLYRYNSTDATIIQVTNFIQGEGKNAKVDSTFWMVEEQNLFEYIQEKNKRKAWRESKEFTIYELASPFYYGKNNLENIQVNPQGKYISFRLSDYPKETETHVENHISADGHTYTTPARAKVGAEEPTHQLGILDLDRDTVYFINFSKLSDIRKKPAYLNDPTPYGKDRKIIMHSLKFAKNSNLAVCDIRSYDNKDRWIVLIDLSNGSFTEIDHQHDEAWIGGPGISSWNAEEGTLGWLNDNQTIYFQSEETGYSHLYFYSTKTKRKEQRTSGNWEIHQLQLSNDGEHFYITGNRSHPGNRDLLRYDITARKIVPILQKNGYHEVILSPDEKTLAVRYSYKNNPWELYLAPNVSNATLKQLTYSTSKSFNAYKWREPEVITFKGSDGKDVYARVYAPTPEKKNGAAVIFVHGAGYLQNAHNYWSNYYREYMFHNLLVDNGFTVLDIDYRASEGYGRDYRTAIYRHMGGQDLQDHLSGKDYLVTELGIDSTRIGIYGGSYGGFITLMAMLTTPGEFPCGAALRSVTDWAHYNHEYTSNILNYPDTDPEAYRKSSPIYYAKNLQGKLLMLHGMVDDNVQFQDIVRLSQRFIELGKENWELAVFPVEAHGFKESYSWYDEYRRIYELFYKQLILNQAK